MTGPLIMSRRRLAHPAPVHPNVTERRLTPSSSFSFVSNAVPASQAQFDEMWERMPPPTMNPRRYGTYINRRQCTYGLYSYDFGSQTSCLQGNFETAPELVRMGLAWVHHDIQRFPALAPEDVVVAHCNYYDGGSASLGIHQDVEPQNKGRPIWSFTFISAPAGGADYRYFCVYKDGGGKELTLPLGLRNGDVFVMEGEFQKEFWHDVPKTSRQDTAQQRRINITYRAWGEASSG